MKSSIILFVVAMLVVCAPAFATDFSQTDWQDNRSFESEWMNSTYVENPPTEKEFMSVAEHVEAYRSPTSANYYLYPDGSGDFPNIQEAVNAASNGDYIWLHTGTYTGDGNRDIYLDKDVFICSTEMKADSVIIDCQGHYEIQHRGFEIRNVTRNCVIAAITIHDGYAWDGSRAAKSDGIKMADFESLSGYEAVEAYRDFTEETLQRSRDFPDGCGGGMLIIDASPTIHKCRFHECAAFTNYFGGMGGCIYAENSGLHIVSGDFTESSANHGAGIAIIGGNNPTLEVWLEGPYFEDCDSNFGAGAVIVSGANCLFEYGRIKQCHSPGSGAGMYISNGAEVILTRIEFYRNNAQLAGGAIYLYQSQLGTAICTLAGNRAGWQSGGMYLDDPLGTVMVNRMTSYDSHSPQGPSFYVVHGGMIMSYCLITDNQHGTAVDVGVEAGVWVECSDIWNNAGGDWVGPIAWMEDNNGNLSWDPLYCDVDIDHYWLQQGTPCHPGTPPNPECDLWIGAWSVQCGGYSWIPEYEPEYKTTVNVFANPFTDNTTLAYELQGNSQVTLGIYDLQGRLVDTLLDQTVSIGHHRVHWDGSDANGEQLATGVYFYRLATDYTTEVGRIQIVR